MRSIVFSLAAAALLSAGCTTANEVPPQPAPFVYRLGAQDVLAITVMREPELTRERLVVGPDGTLGLPGVGSVNVGDKKMDEALALIRAEYGKTFVNPQIGITLIEMRSNRVLVMGEVIRMSPVAFRTGMSMSEAISLVGGYVPLTAKIEDCRVIRGPLTNPKLIQVDLEDVFDGDVKDVALEPGDIVVVPPKYVTRFDRFISQLLSPLRLGSQTAASAATVGTTAGTTTIVAPF